MSVCWGKMMTEHYSFADSPTGLLLAWLTSVSLRRHGFKTRLATRNLAGHVLRTVVAKPPARPPRSERCQLNSR